jgi:hypothetical protein
MGAPVYIPNSIARLETRLSDIRHWRDRGGSDLKGLGLVIEQASETSVGRVVHYKSVNEYDYPREIKIRAGAPIGWRSRNLLNPRSGVLKEGLHNGRRLEIL